MRARLSISVVGTILAVGLGTIGLASCRSDSPPATTAGTSPTTTAPTTTATPSPTTPTTTDPPGLRRITPYWMRTCPPPETATDIAGCRVAPGESRLVPADNAPRAAVDALMSGPNDAEKTAGETSNIRSNVTLYDVTVDNGTATVSFNRYFETAKTIPQAAQVVFTLTQLPEITAVRFLVDREPNGAIGVGGLDRKNFTAVTPVVLLETPTLNASVPAAFKLTGTAQSPGRTVAYQVLGADDTPLVSSVLTILAPTGTRGSFIEPVKLPPGTTGPVVIVTGGPGAEVRTPVTIA